MSLEQNPPEDSSGDSEYVDPVVEFYKKDVDRTLLRENLKLTPAERASKFESFMRFAHELRESGKRARKQKL